MAVGTSRLVIPPMPPNIPPMPLRPPMPNWFMPPRMPPVCERSAELRFSPPPSEFIPPNEFRPPSEFRPPMPLVPY